MTERVVYEDLSPSEQKKYWEGLFMNPAWVSLCQALQAQADALQQEIIYGTIRSVEDTYRLEGLKGELRGKLSASVVAETMYQTAIVEIQEAIKANQGE